MEVDNQAGLQAIPSRGVGDVLRPLILFVVLAGILLSLSRASLVLWQRDRVLEVGQLQALFVCGMRFDAVILGLVLLLPCLLGPLLMAIPGLHRAGRMLLCGYLAIMLTALLFMEFATPSFLEEFDSRPNYLFVEYLMYPKEVLSTLWGSYPLQLIVLVFLVPTGLWFSYRLFTRSAKTTGNTTGPLRLRVALPLALLLSMICLGAARSTLGHRPINPSIACISSDPMVNTLPLSSLYSVAYAIYETNKHETSGKPVYGKLPYETVIDEVRRASQIPADRFSNSEIPTLHRQEIANPRATPLNLVIILEESLGAEFVGALGGLPLTPQLDALMDEGLAFDQLYATGTRSVRGIEAVTTSFLPTPARSVVKLPRSQRGFFTIAQLLKQHGYRTSFLYGGEAHFDNMGRFFSGNGFDRIVDRKSFKSFDFEGSWGVSDGDLFRRAHEEFEKSADTPFFSLVFSSSNHSPWEFPTDGFELFEQPVATRNNATKYADHALGEFFQSARQSSYWENTVFLVVADHNSRVYGPALVPVEHFHIPGVFLGGQVEPARIETLASQIDLLPTALALIGLESEHVSLGRDLTDPANRALPGRAILQFNTSNLYLTENAAVLHRPQHPPTHLRWTGTELISAPEDAGLEFTALAHALWPQMSYSKSDYRLPIAGTDGP